MNTLSEKFKVKRKELGLTQQTLAEGICEQSQISKIERGNFMPPADLLFKLSQRLEVPLGYFFDENLQIQSNLDNFKHIAQRLLDDRNYDDLEYLYKIERDKKHFRPSEDNIFLEWIKAIIDFYKYDKKNKAIIALEHSLTKLSSKSLLYLKVLNTLSNFYSLVGRDQDYEANYSHLIEIYQTKKPDYQELIFGYIRVRYNYAHYLVSKEKYKLAIQEALETIEFCKSKQTSYQLAPLLTLVGNSGLQLLDKDQIKSYYLEAKELCKIYNNPLMLMKLETYLKDLEGY